MAQNLLRPAAPGQLPMHLFQAGGVLSGGGLPGLAQMASVPQLGPGRTPASSGRDAAGRPIMPLPASSHGSPGPFTMISKQSKVGSNLPPLQGAVFPTSSFALGGAGGAAWAMLGLGHPITQLSTLQGPGAGPASSMGLWGQAQGQAAGIQLLRPFTLGAPPFGISARGAALHAPAPIDLIASAAGDATAVAQDQGVQGVGKPPFLGSGAIVAQGASIQLRPLPGECIDGPRGDVTAAAITTAIPQGGDTTTFMASVTPSVDANTSDFTSSLKYSPTVSGGEMGPVSFATSRDALGDVSAELLGSPIETASPVIAQDVGGGRSQPQASDDDLAQQAFENAARVYWEHLKSLAVQCDPRASAEIGRMWSQISRDEKDEIIRAIAERQGVPGNVLVALVRSESKSMRYAYESDTLTRITKGSQAGRTAVGILQMTPDFLNLMAKLYPEIADDFNAQDPIASLKLAARWIADRRRRYEKVNPDPTRREYRNSWKGALRYWKGWGSEGVAWIRNTWRHYATLEYERVLRDEYRETPTGLGPR